MVRRNPFALVVHDPEVVVGIGDALLGRPPVPLHRLGVVRRNPFALVVHDPEVVLGLGVSLLGQRLHQSECRRVVSPFIGGGSILVSV